MQWWPETYEKIKQVCIAEKPDFLLSDLLADACLDVSSELNIPLAMHYPQMPARTYFQFHTFIFALRVLGNTTPNTSTFSTGNLTRASGYRCPEVWIGIYIYIYADISPLSLITIRFMSLFPFSFTSYKPY